MRAFVDFFAEDKLVSRPNGNFWKVVLVSSKAKNTHHCSMCGFNNFVAKSFNATQDCNIEKVEFESKVTLQKTIL